MQGDLIDQLGKEAMVCRQLIREMHGAQKDLRQCIREANAFESDLRRILATSTDELFSDIRALVLATVEQQAKDFDVLAYFRGRMDIFLEHVNKSIGQSFRQFEEGGSDVEFATRLLELTEALHNARATSFDDVVEARYK